MLTPAYQFHAQRFNANTVLLAVWPIATYCFLRSFETRSTIWALIAGATTALAILGKYYSIFLFGGFVFAALVHPQRRMYFSTSAPWISTATGLFVLAPHLYWLATTGAGPLKYALEVHRGATATESLIESGSFLLGLVAALALPTITWVMIAGCRLRQFAADVRSMDRGLLLLLLIGVGAIIFPIVTTASLGSDLPSLWAFQGLFLFIVPIVCGAGFPVERFYSVNLILLVLGITAIAVLVAAPAHAIYRNSHPFNERRNFYRSSAIELERRWHGLTDKPLPRVSGDEPLALATAFYSPEHPEFIRAWDPQDAWAPSQAILKQGWAALCFSDDKGCIAFLERNTLPSRSVRSEFTVTSFLFDVLGATAKVIVQLTPPESLIQR